MLRGLRARDGTSGRKHSWMRYQLTVTALTGCDAIICLEVLLCDVLLGHVEVHPKDSDSGGAAHLENKLRWGGEGEGDWGRETGAEAAREWLMSPD